VIGTMAAVSETELTALVFTDRDAILVSDSTQLDFLMSKGNTSIEESWMMPVTTHAYEAILAHRHRRVRPHFTSVDFADCLRWYHEEGLRHARTWLSELGLRFDVEGIDVASLDAPSQFLLFTHARYIEATTDRLIRASADIETFYVVTARDPLPLDFYFDSDVAAGVMQYACERLGRPVRPIVMDRRTRFIFSQVRHRPITDAPVPDQRTPVMASFSGLRVGIAPATIANQELILDGLRELRCQITFFPSVWSGLDPFGISAQHSHEHSFHVSALDDEQSVQIAAELATVREAVAARADRSTLPSSIIRNPHASFQLDYIVERRWRSYANMIHRAAGFVADHPLDLFILSDAFTAEGAILSRLYRRRGTRVLVSLHSGWPCDPNWATWDASDAAMVPSKSAAHRVKALSGMADVHVIGPPQGRTYRNLLHPSPPQRPIELRNRIAHDRKVVVLVTNALELNGVPFIDLPRHFETVSKLARVPPSLQPRVVVALRAKHKPLGDGPALYGALSDLPEESRTLLDGLSFSEVVEVADCVVGVNLPTTGYFEVLAKGVPMIQVKAADVCMLPPDLPPEVVGLVTDLDDVWAAIESVLFDEERRRRVLELQRRFIADDLQPDGSGGNPVAPVLSALVQRGNVPTWAAARADDCPSPEAEPTIGFDRLNPPGPSDRCAGYVSDLLLAPDGCGVVIGWAVDLTARQAAAAVHVYCDGRYRGTSRPMLPRPDVAEALNDQRFAWSGFRARVTFEVDSEADTVGVYAELQDGTLCELSKTTGS
jgi:hypothetical protein